MVQTVEDLRNGDVKPKDRALALASLRTVCDRLYGWDKEPDIHEMERAKNYAINIQLQNTSPAMLKQMALAKYGSLAPEQDGQGGGPSPIREDLGDSGVGGPLGEKGDPKELAIEKQGAPVSGVYHGVAHGQHDQREKAAPKPQTHIQGNPPSATAPNVQFGSPPLSSEERRKQQLEEIARLQAEWRGQRR